METWLRFFGLSELEAFFAVATGLGSIMVLDEGPDLFEDAVSINSILGVQQVRVSMWNETIGHADAQDLTTVKVSGLQQLQDGAPESAHQCCFLNRDQERFLVG